MSERPTPPPARGWEAGEFFVDLGLDVFSDFIPIPLVAIVWFAAVLLFTIAVWAIKAFVQE